MSTNETSLELIEQRIIIVRGQKVMVDSDLAMLYGVATKRLNEQVKRNIDRFPQDFMFQLSYEEKEQVVANCDHLQKLKFSPVFPYVFTEHGAVMLATILNSPVAIEASIKVVRAFVQLRSILAAHKELAKKIDQLEKETKSDYKTILKLLNPPIEPKPKIGYRT